MYNLNISLIKRIRDKRYLQFIFVKSRSILKKEKKIKEIYSKAVTRITNSA